MKASFAYFGFYSPTDPEKGRMIHPAAAGASSGGKPKELLELRGVM